MKTHWHRLNDRERLIVCIGGLFCGLYLFYAVLYAPLHRAVDDKKQQLIEKKATLAWMQQMRQQYKINKPPQVLSNSKLLTTLGLALNKASFHTFVYQLQQTGAGDIQLSYEQVPYNAFVTWLWSISDQYTFHIKQFSAEHTQTPGVVNVVVLIASGA